MGAEYVVGLIGYAGNVNVNNCYTMVDVSGNGVGVGGLIGLTTGSITNSFATGNVANTFKHTSGNTGGLVGSVYKIIFNCYATGNVIGGDLYTGGLVGESRSTISNSYATGDVTGGECYTGGLVGSGQTIVHNSYATGNVSGVGKVGGLCGEIGAAENCYSTGNVSGTGMYIRGLIGYADINTINCYTTGDVNSSGHAVENRLMSAIEQISTAYDNLVSSLSTVKDADIGEISSEYIKKQILQQASATLLATANQSPSIALQLI